MTQKQGIVSILASDSSHERPTRASSLKRTLSADMSSKTWMAQNGFSFPPPLMKKIASSEQIVVTRDGKDEEDEDEEGVKNPRQIDIWAAILSQKTHDDSSKLPPPYVHPLVKKSASSLSEKSLKVCTESLGSETGSDVFSGADEKKDKQEEEYCLKGVNNTITVIASTTTTQLVVAKKSQQARALPPPLPSLAAARTDGPSLHMHSRRVDGRLVVEAVSIPSQKYFETQRQDGRFLLTLINDPKDQAPKNDTKVGFEDMFEDEDETNMRILKEQAISDHGPTHFHKTSHLPHKTVITKNITERDNMNPTWPEKVNHKATKLLLSPITQSIATNGLPPLPRPPAATSFNSYQYFWKTKPTVASVIDPLITQQRPPAKNKAYDNKDLVLQRGNKADCLLPSLKGCKEPRRPLLMWEPFCIATS